MGLVLVPTVCSLGFEDVEDGVEGDVRGAVRRLARPLAEDVPHETPQGVGFVILNPGVVELRLNLRGRLDHRRLGLHLRERKRAEQRLEPDVHLLQRSLFLLNLLPRRALLPESHDRRALLRDEVLLLADPLLEPQHVGQHAPLLE